MSEASLRTRDIARLLVDVSREVCKRRLPGAYIMPTFDELFAITKDDSIQQWWLDYARELQEQVRYHLGVEL